MPVCLEISASLAGLRLDKALASHPEIQTRSRAAKLIELGSVKKKDLPVKPSQITVIGEIYSIEMPARPEKSGLTPYALALDIVFEDEELLVVNKPSGLVVHPAAGHFQDTLVNALLHHTQDLAMGFNELRPGIVHRLDKDTSGLLVVAKTNSAHEALSQQFRDKSVHRLYWAIVHGTPHKGHGTFKSYLARNPVHRKKFASIKDEVRAVSRGKLAITHYELIKSHPSGLSLVHCRLETGRTHQIRVHLSESTHALIGDPLYGNPGRIKNLKSVRLRPLVAALTRTGLHAAELGFTHPTTKAVLRFQAPWPDDLKDIAKELGFS